MNRYGAGVRFERYLRQVLEAAGFSVIRGAGSKGHVFGEKADLVATLDTGQNRFTGYMLVIQCKKKKS